MIETVVKTIFVFDCLLVRLQISLLHFVNTVLTEEYWNIVTSFLYTNSRGVSTLMAPNQCIMISAVTFENFIRPRLSTVDPFLPHEMNTGFAFYKYVIELN